MVVTETLTAASHWEAAGKLKRRIADLQKKGLLVRVVGKSEKTSAVILHIELVERYSR